MPPKTTLNSLPNEVFVQILTPFSTRALLPLTTVSHRLNALILRILHYRLLVSASLQEYKLILECFHPSSKLIEPHVFCRSLGTEGLSDKYEGEGSLYEGVRDAGMLGRLGSLYSRFQPEGSGVIRGVNLEPHEEFSQLCVVINVVKVIPGTEMLLSAVNVVDGVVRLFRGWLAGMGGRAWERDAGEAGEMIWVDGGRNVGLRVRVRRREYLNLNLPVLMRDEEAETSYELEVEEVHVRTTRLLLTMEQSVQEQQNNSKAVIFTIGAS